MKKIISSNMAPKAIGPYSHATSINGLIFTSGQLPVDKQKGGVVDGGITEQSRQSILNLKYVLETDGSSLESVLKTTCYLSDINDFSAFNDVYKEFFLSDFPARSCFAVKDLPLGVKIEIEAVACQK